MTHDSLQAILRGLFGEGAGEAEAIARTERGPMWAFRLKGDYDSALERWDRLREALADVPLWPLLASPWGREEDVRRSVAFYESSRKRDPQDPLSNHSSDDLLREGLALDVDEWLRSEDEKAAQIQAWRQAWIESQGYSSHEEYVAALDAKKRRTEALIAQKCKDGEADEDGYVSFFTEDGGYMTALCGERGHDSAEDPSEPDPVPAPERRWQPPSSIWILLVPASHGWEVPATLHFGNWNACPAPQMHVAMIRHWHRKYGAQLDSLSHDMIGFRVPRPPQSREEALPLAHQMWHFCSKYSYEGFEDETPSPEQQADDLVNRSRWGFWWD